MIILCYRTYSKYSIFGWTTRIIGIRSHQDCTWKYRDICPWSICSMRCPGSRISSSYHIGWYRLYGMTSGREIFEMSENLKNHYTYIYRNREIRLSIFFMSFRTHRVRNLYHFPHEARIFDYVRTVILSLQNDSI